MNRRSFLRMLGLAPAAAVAGASAVAAGYASGGLVITGSIKTNALVGDTPPETIVPRRRGIRFPEMVDIGPRLWSATFKVPH